MEASRFEQVIQGCAAVRTKLTAFPIITAAFRTAHIPLNEQLSCQLIQQRLSVFQIGGFETFHEPVVNVCDHRAGFAAAALVHQQACEGQGCGELEKLGALVPGNLDRGA